MRIIQVFCLILFLQTITHDAVAQKLEIKFYPAFLYDSKCSMYWTSDSLQLELDIYKEKNSLSTMFSETKKIPLTLEKEFKELLRSSEIFYDDNSMGLDGIQIEGNYTDSTMSKNFKFWSPTKGTKSHELFKITWKTLSKYLEDKKSKKYLKYLKKYM